MLGKLSVRVLISIIAISIVGGYALFESRNLIIGPVIIVEEPQSGKMTDSYLTDIVGTTQNVVWISMNDREISVDESGRFEEKFALSEGNNTVKITAKDRFGRQEETYIEIFHQKPNKPLVQR